MDIKVNFPSDSGSLLDNLTDAHIVAAVNELNRGGVVNFVPVRRGMALHEALWIKHPTIRAVYDWSAAHPEKNYQVTVDDFVRSALDAGIFHPARGFGEALMATGAGYFFGALSAGAAMGGFSGAAGTSAATTTAGGAGSFSASVAASQAETAALLSTAPQGTLLAAVSPTASATLGQVAALQASNAALLAAPLTDAAIAGVGTAAANSGAGIFSTLQSAKQGWDMASIFDGIGSNNTIFDGITGSSVLGTVTDVAGAIVDTYGTVLDTQLKLASLDAAKTQAQARIYQPTATPTSTNVNGNQGGGINWGAVGVGVGVLALIVGLVRSR